MGREEEEEEKRYGLNLGQPTIEIGTNDSEDSCYIKKIGSGGKNSKILAMH